MKKPKQIEINLAGNWGLWFTRADNRWSVPVGEWCIAIGPIRIFKWHDDFQKIRVAKYEEA